MYPGICVVYIVSSKDPIESAVDFCYVFAFTLSTYQSFPLFKWEEVEHEHTRTEQKNDCRIR